MPRLALPRLALPRLALPRLALPRIALIGFLTLTACGAEGPPQPPSGVSVTGTASAGVVTKG